MRGRGIPLVALLWCGFVVFVHWIASDLACGWDTSYCAQSRVKNGVYRGVLTNDQRRPHADQPFSIIFASRTRQTGVTGFSTDAAGRYCVVWAEERVVPFAIVDSVVIPFDSPWEPLNGSPPPPNCQTSSADVPWNRADDARTSLQFNSVLAVIVAAAISLLLALQRGLTRQGRRARGAGLGLTLASTLLVFGPWFF